MQRAQKMNNIVDASLRRQLEQFERQRINSITLIDQDRLDIHDFLKNLKKCPSEELPETRHWLGDRTPSGRRVPRTTRLIIRNQSANANLELEEEARKEEMVRQERERAQMLHFRSRPKPELVQRTMALHRLFSKRNLYAGVAIDAWGNTFTDPPPPERELESRGNVTFKDSGIGMESECTRSPDFDKDTLDEKRNKSRRSERLDSVREHETGKGDCGRPGCQGHHHSREGHEDFMKELLVGKYRKKRKKKEPLEDRINGFYEKMEILKKEEIKRTQMPSPLEMQRRWVTLTKGAKVAIADSSDEEDGNELHTL